MNTVLLTLYEGHYHYGVAALVNSAIANGFRGTVCLIHRGPLPPWEPALATAELHGCRIVFRSIDTPRHLGYEKPFAMLQAFDIFPDCEVVAYADPDILFLGPWSFMDDWMSHGVAYCLDSNYPYLPNEHPWRGKWRQLVHAALHRDAQSMDTYPNSGFIGIRRSDREFLEDFCAITVEYEKLGGNTSSFQMTDRHEAVVGDQDLMAATLMAWRGQRSVLGPDGMGFTGHFFVLSHHIRNPKPWIQCFSANAAKGAPPSQAADFYLDYANSPIPATGMWTLRMKRLDILLAKLISRIWRRA